MVSIRTTYLERLLACPQQLFFAEEYPTLDIPSEGQQRGSLFHKYASAILSASDRESAYLQARHELKALRPDILPGLDAAWRTIFSNKRIQVVAIEEEFSKELNIDGRAVCFRGTLDFVFQIDDTLIIGDFKLLKNPRHFMPTLQRFTYPLFSPYRDSCKEFWFLLVGTEGTLDPLVYDVQHIRNDPEIEEQIYHLIRHYLRLRELRYKRVGKHCSWCPFVNICLPHKELAVGKVFNLLAESKLGEL
jgi:hypothetical protein